MRTSAARAEVPLLDTSVFTGLARFRAAAAGRAESAAHLRILDAWVEEWLPRLDKGTPQELLACCRDTMAAFHAGSVIPSEGPASGYAMEEYVSALDLARAAARSMIRERIARAPRKPTDEEVMWHAKLPSIARALAEPRAAFPRKARLVNESDSGWAMDLAPADAALLRPGELVCLCREVEPALLARVMRVAPVPGARRIRLGLRRIPGGSAPVVILLQGLGLGSPEPVLFVPNARDARRDGLLLSRHAFDSAAGMRVAVDGREFALRLRRVRERGAGWVFCGFEVAAPGGG